MKNILIRLDDQTYEQLKTKAKSSHTSMAGLVREATAKYLAGASLRADDPILALEGRARSKRKDASTRHDAYIYDPEL